VWKIQLLYIRLLDERPTILDGLYTDHIILIHRVDEINGLGELFTQLIEGREIGINAIYASLELQSDKIKYEDSYLSSLGKVFGINNYCCILLKCGTNSTSLHNIERQLLADLTGRFDRMGDAVMNTLHLPFQWNFSYAPFVAILAPVVVDVVDVSSNNGRISINLKCAELINSDGLRVKIYFLDNAGNQVGLPQEIEGFTRSARKVSLLSHIHLSDSAVSATLRLYYYDDIIAEKRIL
ncbi:MAG: hypothetical protein WAM14_23165, partial [Candidatus Nitrosopolaris sp.]